MHNVCQLMVLLLGKQYHFIILKFSKHIKIHYLFFLRILR